MDTTTWIYLAVLGVLLLWLIVWAFVGDTIKGAWRLKHGYCPVCNSSPPQSWCPVCGGERNYGPNISDLTRARWAARWENL